jgi:hypothetical protein
MTKPPLEELLDAWMDLGPTAAPDRVTEAASLEARSTRQTAIRLWWPQRRFPEMSNIAKLALGAAAVIVAALLGIQLVTPGADGIGGPAVTTEPTPSPMELPNVTGELAAGRYFVDDPAVTPVRFTLEVPAGWETIEGGFLGKIADRAFYVSVSSWIVDNAYVDPCQWVESEIDPPIGPTVDDLADALADQVGRDGSEPTDVTLGGYEGKKVELSVPADFQVASCDNGELRTWRSGGSAGGYNYGPGQRDTVYILDVEGERLVIHTTYLPRASEEDLAELAAIVESIRIETDTPDATGVLGPAAAGPLHLSRRG